MNNSKVARYFLLKSPREEALPIIYATCLLLQLHNTSYNVISTQGKEINPTTLSPNNQSDVSLRREAPEKIRPPIDRDQSKDNR